MTPFQKSNFGFVKSATGQERNFYPVKKWDFMSPTAIFPRCWNAPAFDTSTPPYLILETRGGHDYMSWSAPTLQTGYDGQLCYRTVTTIITYNYGRVETSVSTVFDYWLNPMNPTAPNPAHGSLPDYATSYTGMPTYVPAQDLRLTGCPTQPETLSESWSNGINLTLVGGDGTYPSYYIAPDGKFYTNPAPADSPQDQSNCPPPTITETSCLQTYDFDGIYSTSNGARDGSAPTAGLAIIAVITSIQTLLSDEVDVEAACQGLFSLIPAMDPREGISTREGPFYFNYFGLSSVDKSLFNHAGGATYALDGTATISVPANNVMGIQPGPNESTSAPLIATARLSVGSQFPYYFDPANTAAPLVSGLKIPLWAGGSNQWNSTSASVPDCAAFCSATTTAKLSGGGWPSSIPQWSAGLTPSAGDIIVQVNDGTATFPYYKMQCATPGTGGGSEPAWGSYSVGANVNDGTIVWKLLAKGAPVTALVTQTHVNRLLIFRLNTGNVLTAQTGLVPLFPAVNGDPNTPNGSSPPGFPGFVCQSSRLLVPANPLTVTQDIALFNDINVGGAFPNLQLNIIMATQFDANFFPDYYHYSATAFYEILTTGETFVNYSDVDLFSPTTMGFIYLGQPGDINYTTQSNAAGNTNAGAGNSGGVGGSNQDSQGI